MSENISLGQYLYETILKKPEIGIELLKTVIRRLSNMTRYATRLEKDTLEYRSQLRKLRGLGAEEEPTFEEELIRCGFITREQLDECKASMKRLKEQRKSTSLLKLIIEKGFLPVEQLLQYLEIKQMK